MVSFTLVQEGLIGNLLFYSLHQNLGSAKNPKMFLVLIHLYFQKFRHNYKLGLFSPSTCQCKVLNLQRMICLNVFFLSLHQNPDGPNYAGCPSKLIHPEMQSFFSATTNLYHLISVAAESSLVGDECLNKILSIRLLASNPSCLKLLGRF